MKRTICVITGSRSEYGLLKPLLSAIAADRALTLRLLVTGTHLSKAFGSTVKQIEADGFKVSVRVPILDRDDSGLGVARAMGRGMAGFAKAFHQLKPDLVLGMGDRYELLAASAAALVNRIPMAHLSGGELSQGAIDDSFRHAVTKMSHLHFVSNAEHRRRVIQLGEDPARVYNTGEVGLDQLEGMQFLDRPALERDLGFAFQKYNILATFHPVTAAPQGQSLKQAKAMLEALDQLKDAHIILTKANADAEGRAINSLLEKFVSQRRERMSLFASLGSLRYLSLMKQVQLLAGNSSSALVEAPSFYLPAVNIGDRQKGRLKGRNVIDCKPDRAAIYRAIVKGLSPAFRKSLTRMQNPYGDGRAASRIVRVLKTVNLGNLMVKGFYDI